jgi:hypothetical protein
MLKTKRAQRIIVLVQDTVEAFITPFNHLLLRAKFDNDLGKLPSLLHGRVYRATPKPVPVNNRMIEFGVGSISK